MNNKQKAIELLGEEKKCDYLKIVGSCSRCWDDGDCITQSKNQMHSKAVEVVVGLLEEMELKIGVWLCPKCKRGCPSGKICRDCLEQELQTIKQKYQELIMAVSKKYPNETRHQTALKYIVNSEKVDSRIGKSTNDK